MNLTVRAIEKIRTVPELTRAFTFAGYSYDKIPEDIRTALNKRADFFTDGYEADFGTQDLDMELLNDARKSCEA